ncbi:MAG: hypothetical protein L0229_18680 [Blastocatellia bacterium]|nr:hypothetical protein [Blastocatellia bacterium]
MIKSKVVICAEKVIRDAETNSVSIINLIEGINAQAFPVLIPGVSVFGLFEKDKDDPTRFKSKLDIVHNKSIIFSTTSTLDFEDKQRTRFIVSISGLIISDPGSLEFIFYRDKGRVGSYQFNVNLVGEPQVATIQSDSTPKSISPKSTRSKPKRKTQQKT